MDYLHIDECEVHFSNIKYLLDQSQKPNEWEKYTNTHKPIAALESIDE